MAIKITFYGGENLTGKSLGKITEVKFGFVDNHIFGLDLHFKTTDGDVNWGYYYNPKCNSIDNVYEYDRVCRKIENILKDSQVKFVHELKNKPVEVTWENNVIKEFRILTEVI